MKKEGQKRITVMEAVDNLSSMVEIDQGISPEQLREQVFHAPEGEEEGRKALRWIDPKRGAVSKEEIKETLRALHDYFEELYTQKSEELQDPETQRGVQAIMLLVAEAGKKLDKFRAAFQREHEERITELHEYRALQQLYLTKVLQKFEQKELFHEEWKRKLGEIVPEIYDLKEQGIKDLETVKRDEEYELFSIVKEDGKPYFNQNLLRHIRLVGNFDHVYSETQEEDPFLRIRLAIDRDLHQTAKEIKKWVGREIADFYYEAMPHKERPFVAYLNKALMALMLAANARNLIPNTEAKSCLAYFNDFHHYLREALTSDLYQQFINSPPDLEEQFYHTLLNLSHGLCCSLFMRIGSRKEMVSIIHRLVEGKSAEKSKKAGKNPQSIWGQLLSEDAHLRYLLERYPNGPLMKAFDAFRQRDEGRGFDPLSQENYPSLLYTLVSDRLHLSFLRVPCPTFQEKIDKAETVEEFRGLLRYFKREMPEKRHLLFNLQDRTSWSEHARCRALEELQTEEEFQNTLFVVTFPKDTAFYRQDEEYTNLSNATEFKKILQEQVESGASCGFFFPRNFITAELGAYANQAIDLIHTLFFEEEKELSKEKRLDFIELFYLFFSLYFIRELIPDSVSFTCKDGVDVGAAMSCSFFSFLRMLGSDLPWSASERDFLLWMLYAPGLMIRERAIQVENLRRMVSSMELSQQRFGLVRKSIEKAVLTLLGQGVFSGFRIEEASA